jgi:hypothetical protein
MGELLTKSDELGQESRSKRRNHQCVARRPRRRHRRRGQSCHRPRKSRRRRVCQGHFTRRGRSYAASVPELHELQDVVAAALCGLDRLALVAMEPKRLAGRVGLRLVPTEDRAAALMQEAFVDEVVDRPSGLEGRVQLHYWVRPQEAFCKLAIDTLADSLVADNDEAACVVGEVIDETSTKIEDVHLARLLRNLSATEEPAHRCLPIVISHVWSSKLTRPLHGGVARLSPLSGGRPVLAGHTDVTRSGSARRPAVLLAQLLVAVTRLPHVGSPPQRRPSLRDVSTDSSPERTYIKSRSRSREAHSRFSSQGRTAIPGVEVLPPCPSYGRGHSKRSYPVTARQLRASEGLDPADSGGLRRKRQNQRAMTKSPLRP